MPLISSLNLTAATAQSSHGTRTITGAWCNIVDMFHSLELCTCDSSPAKVHDTTPNPGCSSLLFSKYIVGFEVGLFWWKGWSRSSFNILFNKWRDCPWTLIIAIGTYVYCIKHKTEWFNSDVTVRGVLHQVLVSAVCVCLHVLLLWKIGRASCRERV